MFAANPVAEIKALQRERVSAPFTVDRTRKRDVIIHVITFGSNFEAAMTDAVKIRAIGNSLGVTLPREVLLRHRMAEGDILHVVDTADGIRLVRHNPEFARQMEVAREVMHRRRDVLRELAK